MNPKINEFDKEKFYRGKDKLMSSLIDMDVIEFSPNEFHPYWRTKFGIMETEISFMEPNSI